MKATKRFLLTLAAILGMTGAWAQDADEVAVTKTANNNEWTLTMPASNVELQVEYYMPFDLTLADGSNAHGTVAFTVGDAAATQALKDDVVTVSVTPADGYTVKGVTAQTSSQVVVPMTNGENGWTFTMPEENVAVTVTYAKNLQDAWIQTIADQTYTGSAIEPSIEVKDGETTLVLNTDYTVAYSNNVEGGSQGVVTITGIGNYSGTVSKTFNVVAAVYSTANAAIDVNVPEGLGQLTPETTGQTTDLYYFLQSYLQNSPNPAYIKLRLASMGQYVISQPLTVLSAITIEGDAEGNATIDASHLGDKPFVIIDRNHQVNEKNEKGFLTSIYNVEFKNFIVEKALGSLFSSNGQKYVIPNFTVENVLVQTTGGTVIDMDGSVVENLTVTKSTMNGAALAYKATTDAASAGVTAQTINASYNTFYQVIGLQIGAMLTAPQMSNRSMAPTSNLSLDFNHNVVISDNFAFNGQAPSSMLVQYNSFVKADGTDNSAILTYVPGVGGTIEGDLVFAAPDEVANGNLGLGACPQKTAKIGDPRWLDAAMKISTADLDDDKDLAKAINQGVENGITKFQLEENARYTAKQTIVADKAIAITGKNVIIDVEHNDPFIQLSTTPAEAAVSDYFRIDQMLLKGLEIKGIKNSIIYDNNTKYCVVDLTIDDCVLGLETEAVKNEALISFQAGGAKDFTIKNSTVYGNNAVAKYFIRYNNSARLDRYGFDKNTEFQTMTYQNNTFYGLLKSDGQWGNYSGIAGQNYSKFVVEKNIWYNSSNEIIRRMAGGRFGGNAPRTFDKNTYFLNGADNSAKEAGYDQTGTALTTDPGFKDAANGDFTLSAYSAQCNEKTGDPRWFAEGGHYNPVTGIETVKTAEETSLENAVIYNLNGQRVEKAQKGINIVNGKKVIIK